MMEKPRSTIRATEQHKIVYINPNFKRDRTTGQVQVNSSMHINPNFSHQLSVKIPTSEANASRIYINPNFIRTTQPALVASMQSIPTTSNTLNSDRTSESSVVTNSSTKYIAGSISSSVALPNVTKSRYCLVRKNNENKIFTTEIRNKTTYTINKYKSMPMQDLKNNINSHDFNNTKVKRTLKPCFATTLKTTKYTTSPRTLSSSHYKFVKNKPQTSHYRFVKASTSTSTSSPVRISNRRLSLAKNTPRSMKPRENISKKTFKKNNIPCPLYRKYGKCLRKSQGDCEFLHDKKHVSICRKFLKGICFDNACPLSHEISKEKMPTCSFYLRGMCLKEDCPYLHVKLNEDTQICSDFLKGYCEKGVECLNRHINICPDLAVQGFCHKIKCPHPHKITKNVMRLRTPCRVNPRVSQLKHSKQDTEKKVISPKDNGTITEDCRYYKEVTGTAEYDATAVEVIKPSRCKLGTLPSFIQL